MSLYASLPLLFLKFYFFDGPKALFLYFISLNKAFLNFFSLPQLIQTFFVPWKNEYRKDFIAVAIGISVVIKTFVIMADLVMFLVLVWFEVFCLLVFLCWPLLTIGLLFLRL